MDNTEETIEITLVEWSNVEFEIGLLKDRITRLLVEVERRRWHVVADDGNPPTDGSYLIKYRRGGVDATIIAPAVWDNYHDQWFIYGAGYGKIAYAWADVLGE